MNGRISDEKMEVLIAIFEFEKPAITDEDFMELMTCFGKIIKRSVDKLQAQPAEKE